MKKPFIPNKLPIALTEEEASKLADLSEVSAQKLLDLNAALEKSTYKDLILKFFLIHESLNSCKIEGNAQILNCELFKTIFENKSSTSNDIREVSNNLRSIETGVSDLDSLPFSTRLFHKLNCILLEKTKGQNQAPGEFKRIQNFIGPIESSPKNLNVEQSPKEIPLDFSCPFVKAGFIPLPPDLVVDYMGNLENYANYDYDDTTDKLIKAGIIHGQFELIHPYMDGNGRLGRVLNILYLINEKMISLPSLLISEALEENKYSYYELLNNLGTDNPDWYEWLKFFLDITLIQSERYLKRLEAIEGLLDSSFTNKDLFTDQEIQKVIDTLSKY